MRRLWIVPLLIAVSCAIPVAASAAAPGHDVKRIFRNLGNDIIVPVEWDGIWTVVDSTYDCAGGPATNVSADEDTICGGETFSDDTQFELSCAGTATTTNIDVTCIGSSEVFPNCRVDYNISYVVTRTASTYYAVTTVNTSYSGTGEGCDLIPPNCTRIVSRGTRTGPAPNEYCLTPVKRGTWGQVKILYR